MAFNLNKENQQLREQLKKYEEILERVLEGPQFEGIIASKVFNNRYRLLVNDRPTFATVADNQLLSILKPGDRVMVTKDNVIAAVLPDELKEKKEPSKFNFIKWEEIGGLKSQIEKIRDTIENPVKYAHLYQQYGLSAAKGVVLHGPAGCGKTMIAKAIASDILNGSQIDEDSFIYLKGGEMLSPYVGVAENNIKSIFERARRHFNKTGTRSVIFIDEAEAILPARGSRHSSDVETTIVPTFLSEMDGFEDNATFIILATNFLYQLDKAVIRPGRIDLNIEIGRPTEEDIKDILQVYLKKTKVNGDIDQLISEFLPICLQDQYMQNMSGAWIKNIIDKAISIAIKEEVTGKTMFQKMKQNSGITLDHLKQALTY